MHRRNQKRKQRIKARRDAWKPFADRLDLPEHERQISAGALRVLDAGIAAVQAGRVRELSAVEREHLLEADRRFEAARKRFHSVESNQALMRELAKR